jgi:hypothetical protein
MLMKQTLEIINIFSSIDHWQLNRIGGVMDIMLALRAVYRGFEPRVKPKSMSEGVSDCCLAPTQQFFQLYHGENKPIFNEMMMRSALF